MDLMSTLVDLLDRLQARPMWPDSELTKPSAGIATTADRRAISGEDVPSRNNRETPTAQCEWPHTEGHCNGQLYAPHRSPLGGGSHTEGPGHTQLHTFPDHGYCSTGDDRKPLVIILSEGTVGRSTQQDLGWYRVTFVQTDQWEHLDALSQPSAVKQLYA